MVRMVKLWALWVGLVFIGIYAALYYSGWVNAAAAFVVALVLAPLLYVLVVMLFFDDTRRKPPPDRPPESGVK